jgi:hypothetical protein
LGERVLEEGQQGRVAAQLDLVAGLSVSQRANGGVKPPLPGTRGTGRKNENAKKMLKIEGTNSVKPFIINKSVRKLTQDELVLVCKKGQIGSKKWPQSGQLRWVRY